MTLGLLVLLPALALVTSAGWYGGWDLETATEFAFDSTRLQVAAGVMGGVLVLWLVVVVTTYLLVRPAHLSRAQSVLGGAFVVVLCLALTVPVVLGARYAWVQADLVKTVFEHNKSATVPKQVTKEDPWGGRDRVNILLLGGDGNVHRDGVRTDSMILASISTYTGRTVLFSLPRNMMNAQFLRGSTLQKLYPDGFTGYGDPSAYMLNAVYSQIPALHPGILGQSANEGADALKQAVSGSLRVDVDYYVLVNLLGFRKLVDAMGGVTINISAPVPIGGNTDLGIPPDDYLEPGPNRRLNGFEALWYARGRWGSDDYDRMERQRCMVDAIIDEARPWTLLRRYQSLAEAGKEIVRTDIPSALMPDFVDLASRAKDAPVRSVVFQSSARFSSADPDFDWMRSVVRRALAPPVGTRSQGSRPASSATDSPSAAPSSRAQPSSDDGRAIDPVDACAFRPHGKSSPPG